MCGILGKGVPVGTSLDLSEREISDAMQKIKHRGPDSQGIFWNHNLALGHVRLSILDLSEAASQPMLSNDGRFVISYNGEVYNFQDLISKLQLEMNSRSDTEAVLQAFVKKGAASFTLLNGMFAFAIFDRLLNKLWLVRDRLGIKPLYYSLDRDGICFASEIKSLLVLSKKLPICQVSSLHEWLYYGTTLGERTLHQGVNQLLPGHYLELDLSSFEANVVCYWSPIHYAGHAKFAGSLDERVGRVRTLLEQAVERQLISDVPVGVFLSGGVDSSAITAFASRHYRKGRISTYSVGFDFIAGTNELQTAKAVAQLYGTDHHELHISGGEISQVVENMVSHHDAPFSDAANIPLYLLCSQVADSTKVVLQGDGGDEVFGGYSRYTTLSWLKFARVFAKVAEVINNMMSCDYKYYRRRRYINALRPTDLDKVMALLLTEEDADSDLTQLFGPDIRKEIGRNNPYARYHELQAHFAMEDTVNQMLMVDSMIILPDVFLQKVDRSTMAASVEVRVPFLDNDLVEFCLQLSGHQKLKWGRKKWLLKKALEGVVPNSVLYGPKTGFGVPYGYWLRGALRPLFFDQMKTFDRMNPGVLEITKINALYEEHQSRRRDRAFLLWKILNFMIWANSSGTRFTC